MLLKIEYRSIQDNCTVPPHHGLKLQGRRGSRLHGLPIGEGCEPSAWRLRHWPLSCLGGEGEATAQRPSGPLGRTKIS